jgi:hypothetical protein
MLVSHGNFPHEIRTLSQFAQSSMIQLVASRQVVLRNQSLLSALNS